MCMMIALIFAAISPMPVVAINGITVNGLEDPGEWVAADKLADDPCTTENHGFGPWGYNLAALWEHYDAGSDTLYFRLDVCGVVADLNGDGDPDSPAAVPPGDGPGVGLFEQYTIILDDIVELSYKNNDVAHPKGSAQWGADCVEFQLLDATDYVDPHDYCIRVTAGGSQDLNFSEDTMQVCVSRTCAVAAASRDPPCFEENGTCITFDGSASSAVLLPLSYKWEFTGGFIGTNDNGAITQVFVTAPVTATLTVTDAAGCSDSVNVYVPPCPDEVPIFTPVGMVGLVTVLGALALGTIKMRRRR